MRYINLRLTYLLTYFKYVLILVFFRPPPKKKMTMAQLRHLEIGIDATSSALDPAGGAYSAPRSPSGGGCGYGLPKSPRISTIGSTGSGSRHPHSY